MKVSKRSHSAFISSKERWCSSFLVWKNIYIKSYTIFQQPCWWNWRRGRSVGRSIYNTRGTYPSNSLWLKNLSLSSSNKARTSIRGLDVEAQGNIHRSQLYVRECTKVTITLFQVPWSSLEALSWKSKSTFFIYQRYPYCAVPQTLVRQNNIKIRILIHHKIQKI